MSRKKCTVEVPLGFKWCGKCEEVKLVGEFGTDKSRKDGYYSSCRICAIEQKKKSKNKLKDRVREKPENKICCVCKETKPSIEFPNNCDSKDGLGSYCKSCDKENRKKNYELMKNKQKTFNETKQCNICKEIKHRDNFHIANTASDGLSKICITCSTKQQNIIWKRIG